MASQALRDNSSVTTIDQAFLDDVVRRLLKIDPVKIILFGSYALGTADTDSDVDLLVIKTTTTSKIREMIAARKLLKGLKKPFDVIVSPLDEFEFYKNQINSIYYAADKTGRLLYG